MMKNILAVSLLLAWAAPLPAEIMTYQGRLKDNSLPANGNYAFAFDFCDVSQTACFASTDNPQNFLVSNGLFKSTFTMPSVNLASQAWYLRVSVGGAVLAPMERLTAVPYSVYASSAGYSPAAVQKAGDFMSGQLTLAGSTLTVQGNAFSVGGSTLVVKNGFLGLGTDVPGARLDVLAAGSGPDSMAQIWRDPAGVIISSVSATGVVQAARFVGDGSGITGVTGATGTDPNALPLAGGTMSGSINMGTNSLYSVSTVAASGDVTAARYQILGATVIAVSGNGSFSAGVGAGAVNAGNFDTFVGYYSGAANTTGNYNSFVGFNAGNANTSGSFNAFDGAYAGSLNTTGSSNSVFGYGALANSLTGSANSVVGMQAGKGFAGGSFSSSTLMGYRAGYNLTTGSDNTFLGWQAGYGATTGNNNIVVGYAQDVPFPGASSQINIGGVLFGDQTLKTIGISTRVPQAALDVVATGLTPDVQAQIWRDSTGAVVSSVSATGQLQAVRFIGDGSGLTNVAAATGVDSSKVAKAGDTMTGPLQIHVGVDPVAFQVGVSTLVVKDGRVGINNAAPIEALDIGSGNISIDPGQRLMWDNADNSLYADGNGMAFFQAAATRLWAGSTGGYSTVGAGDIFGVSVDTASALHVVAKGLPTGDGRVAVFGDYRSNGSVAGQYAAAGDFEASVNSTDSLEEAAALRAAFRRDNTGGAVGTVNNAYGLMIADLVNFGGVISKTYGLYIGDQTSGSQATPAFSLYSADPDARSFFAGGLGLGTESPLGALQVSSNVNSQFLVGGADSPFSPSEPLMSESGALVLRSSLLSGIGSDTDIVAAGKVTSCYNSTISLWTRPNGCAGVYPQRRLIISPNGDVGISTFTPQARLDVLAAGSDPLTMAQIWRNSAGAVVSSVSATGVMMGTKFVGDGSGLTNVAAATGVDNTKLPLAGGLMQGALDMGNNYLAGVSTVTMYSGSIAVVPPATGGSNSGYGISIGSNAYDNYSAGVGVGSGAYGNRSYGVGVGAAAYDNYTYGVGVGSNAAGNYSSGVGIGRDAYNNRDSGVGVGGGAYNNYSYGVGVGFNAYANMNYGVGVGAYSSANSDYGVGLGYSAYGNSNRGVGIGLNSTGSSQYGVGVGANTGGNSDYGLGLGASASGNRHYAAGVGAFSQNNKGYGAALGAYSYASSSGTALGAQAKANAELSLALGYGTVNDSTGTASFGGYAVYTSSSVGIGTPAQQARLDVRSETGMMAQIWRDSSGVIVSSVNPAGYLQAVKFIGDGSGLTGLPASGMSGTLYDAQMAISTGAFPGGFNGAEQLVKLDGVGALPALNGSALTVLNPANLSGMVGAAKGGTGMDSSASNGYAKVGGGIWTFGLIPPADIPNLDASKVTSGKFYDFLMAVSTGAFPGGFNGGNQLVKLDAAGAMQLTVNNPTPAAPVILAQDSSNVGEPQVEVRTNGYRGRMSIAGTNGGMYFGSLTPNFLAFHTAGVEWMRLNTQGYLGIGTASPQHYLHISSNTSAPSNTLLKLSDTGTGAPQLLLEAGGHQGRMATAASNGGTYIGTLTNDFLVFQTNSIEQMRIAAGGKVGLGTGAPAEALDLAGRVQISTYAGNADTDGLYSFGINGIKFTNGGNTYMRVAGGGNYVGMGGPTVFSNTNSPKLQVQGSLSVGSTYNSSQPPANSLVVENRVGIGATSPGAQLEIRDNTGTNPYQLLIGTGAAGAFLSVSTGNLVAVGYGRPSTSTVLHAQAVVSNFTGGEDVMAGLIGSARAVGTGPEDVAVGGDFRAEADGNQNLGFLAGLHTELERTGPGSGVIDTAVGLYIDELDNDFGTGGITNTYALYIATQTSGNQTNPPYAVYSVDRGARSYFAGKAGLGTANPRYALEVSSAAGSAEDILAVSTGTDVVFRVTGNGDVHGGRFFGNGAGITGVNGTDSTKVLKAGDTMSGALTINSPTASYAADLVTNGIVISTSGAIRTTGIGNGSVSGSPRGMGAVDLQTYRDVAGQVASGNYTSIGGGLRNSATYHAATVAGGQSNRALFYYATVGGGNTNTADGHTSVVAGGASNTASGIYSAVAGGDTNKALGPQSFVGGGSYNTANFNHGAIGGGMNNITGTAADYAFVGGGYHNVATGVHGAIAGGWDNTASGNDAFVGGGSSNTASGTSYATVTGGYWNTAAGWGASVGGGIFNNASSSYATIAGGSTNTASGYDSFIGGGDLNQVTGSLSVVAGGTYNNAYHDRVFIGGGAFHTVDLQYGTVAGGRENKIRGHGEYSFIGGGAVNITTAPYAVVGGGLQNTSSGTYSGVLGGHWNQATGVAAYIGGGVGNTASGENSSIGGGYGNIAFDPGTTVAGGVSNKANESYSFVGGGYQNDAATGYTAIVGGYQNIIGTVGGDGAYSFIGGGFGNETQIDLSVIGGGETNYIANAGRYGVIGGGLNNRLMDARSAILGGEANLSTATYGTVGGGLSNTSSGTYAAVLGGYSNEAAAIGAVVAGGENNYAGGIYSFVGGGRGNSAPGLYSAVGGGENNNTDWGQYAAIGGGRNNFAFGYYSAIPGGADNHAGGQYSLAAGRMSTTTIAAAGSFAWNDNYGDSLINQLPNTVMFKASGGFWVSTGTVYGDPAFFVDNQNRVGIGTAAPGFKLHVRSSGGAVAGLSTSGNSTDAAVYGWTNGAATAIKGVAASGYAGRFEGNVFVTNDGVNPGLPAKLQVNGDLGLGNGTQTGNAPVVIWLTAAAAVGDGDIVVASGGNQFSTTVTGSDYRAIGVAVGATAGATIGKVAVGGVAVVRCTGATAGQHAITSTTGGVADSTNLPTSGTSIGQFLTSCGTPSAGRAYLLLK